MTTQTTPRNVNGVPVDQLVETMQAVRKEPKIAQFKFSAKNGWLGGARSTARTEGFFGACEKHTHPEAIVTKMDEPALLLGTSKGGNPVEVLLAALSGCLTTSMVYHAAALGIELTEVTSTYEGDLDLHGFLNMDENVRNGYEEIRVTFDVKGDATEEQLDELVRIAQARSPVFDVVTHGTKVKVARKRG